MFYPQKMTQVMLIIPAKDMLAVTKELANMEIFHQAEGKYSIPEKVVSKADSWSEKASIYANLERRTQGILEALGIHENTTAQDGWETMVDINQAQAVIDEVDQQVRKIREGMSEEQHQLDQLQNILDQMMLLSGVDIDFSSIRNPKYIYSILGVIPTPNVERLETSLERIPFVLYPLRQDNQRSIIWLAGEKRNAEVLDRAARAAYLNALSLPENYQGTPAEIVKEIKADMQSIRQRLDEQQTELKMLAKEHKDQMQTLLWQVRASRILAEAIGRFGRSRYTYLINGWVPSSKIELFTRHIMNVAKDVLIETLPYQRSQTSEEVPVALSNPGLIAPFQSFVTNYARPRYDELDPTFILALTFPFLFGAMFGDVGQGILLIILGELIASRKVKALNALAGMGRIVSACGLFATIFGFLYGSIFGFEDILPPLIFSPIHSIITTLIMAILIGLVLLSFGFILHIFNAFVAKDWADLLFDPHGLAGLLLYWSLVGLAVEVATGKTIIPTSIIGIIALIAALTVAFSELLKRAMEGHHPLVEDNIFTYVLQSLLELFEVLISLLSNSVSFVRVGAFAVAHVGLTAVIFILAGLISPGHGIGYYITIAIGNLFIIGFEGMIVGIQTMRLSYYEFFSKFFKGGGVLYQPLTLHSSKVEE